METNEKNRLTKPVYERPEITVLYYERTQHITMSYNYYEEGYGDEISW